MERLDTLVKTSSTGLLDVTVSSRVSRDVFSPDVVIACDVTLPNTDFYVREELTTFHHSGKGTGRVALSYNLKTTGKNFVKLYMLALMKLLS